VQTNKNEFQFVIIHKHPINQGGCNAKEIIFMGTPCGKFYRASLFSWGF